MSLASPPILSVRLAADLGGFHLDAAFQAPAEGVTALVGPSGCGKTSLLRSIAGLERAAGEVRVAGEVWQDETRFLPPYRRPVGFVFQQPALLAHLTVRQNLRFGLKRCKGRPMTSFEEVVELLGVGALLARAPQRLSGGETQRVAIGQALLSQPRLLLLDEPLSNLDAAGKAEILPYLERLHRTLAIPVLYVSHDAGEIDRLADRVLYMQGGRIVGEAAPVGRGPGLPPDAARLALSKLSPERLSGLALAALIAGLEPHGQPPAPEAGVAGT